MGSVSSKTTAAASLCYVRKKRRKSGTSGQAEPVEQLTLLFIVELSIGHGGSSVVEKPPWLKSFTTYKAWGSFEPRNPDQISIWSYQNEWQPLKARSSISAFLLHVRFSRFISTLYSLFPKLTLTIPWQSRRHITERMNCPARMTAQRYQYPSRLRGTLIINNDVVPNLRPFLTIDVQTAPQENFAPAEFVCAFFPAVKLGDSPNRIVNNHSFTNYVTVGRSWYCLKLNSPAAVFLPETLSHMLVSVVVAFVRWERAKQYYVYT